MLTETRVMRRLLAIMLVRNIFSELSNFDLRANLRQPTPSTRGSSRVATYCFATFTPSMLLVYPIYSVLRSALWRCRLVCLRTSEQWETWFTKWRFTGRDWTNPGHLRSTLAADLAAIFVGHRFDDTGILAS